MNFYGWLMTQTARADCIGNLADDARRDQSAPVAGSPDEWRAYLQNHPRCCDFSKTVLEWAITEYENDTGADKLIAEILE